VEITYIQIKVATLFCAFYWLRYDLSPSNSFHNVLDRSETQNKILWQTSCNKEESYLDSGLD
jgi:hypothetical protein